MGRVLAVYPDFDFVHLPINPQALRISAFEWVPYADGFDGWVQQPIENGMPVEVRVLAADGHDVFQGGAVLTTAAFRAPPRPLTPCFPAPILASESQVGLEGSCAQV
jgi:hypothetical protein